MQPNAGLNIYYLIISRRNHFGLVITNVFAVVLNITVPSIKRADVHCSHIIRIGQALTDSSSDAVVIVRSPTPLSELHTQSFFQQGGGQGVSHSDSLLLTIFAGGSFVPVPRQEIVVHFVDEINGGNVGDPHTERTVTVDGIFLEISVHFIGV